MPIHDRASSTRLLSDPVLTWADWWCDRGDATDPAVRASSRTGFTLDLPQCRRLRLSRRNVRTLIRRGAWTSAGIGHVSPLSLHPPVDADVFLAERRRQAVAAVGAQRRLVSRVISGRSAAVLHGLPTVAVAARPELTSLGAGRQGTGERAHSFPARLEPDEVRHWFGVPVTSVARTIVDLARHDHRDGLLAVDAALRVDLVGVDELRRALERARGWPGARRARKVIELADRRSESALESLTRLAIHDAGLPAPHVQVAIPGTSYRVDMLWRRHRLILEADGRAKYHGDELWQEKRREQALRAHGYQVLRVTWDDVLRRWPVTCSWIRAGLAAAC